MILKEYVKIEKGSDKFTTLSLFVDTTYDNKNKMSIFKSVNQSAENEEYTEVLTEFIDDVEDVISQIEATLQDRGYSFDSAKTIVGIPALCYKEYTMENIHFPVYLQEKNRNKLYCIEGDLYNAQGEKYEDADLQYKAFRIFDDIGNFEGFLDKDGIVLTDVMLEQVPFKNRLAHLHSTRDNTKVANTFLVRNLEELNQASDFLGEEAYIFKPSSKYIPGMHKTSAGVLSLHVIDKQTKTKKQKLVAKLKAFV